MFEPYEFTPPTANELAAYDAYLASLPPHGVGPAYDADAPDGPEDGFDDMEDELFPRRVSPEDDR